MNQPKGQLNVGYSALDATARTPTPNSPGIPSAASRGRDSPFPRLIGTQDSTKTQSTAGPPIAIQPRHGSLGKTGRSREAKVRSLIIKDLAKIRHQNSSGKDKILEEQLSPAYRIGADSQVSRLRDDEKAQRQYQKRILPGNSSTLAPCSSESRWKQQRQIQQYSSSPDGAMTAAIENYEILSRPSSNANLNVNRKDNRRLVEKTGNTRERSQVETPLPSSDDEGPDGNFYRKAQRKVPKRHRREKRAPLAIEKRDQRGRSSKSYRATGSRSYSRQKRPRKHASKEAFQLHLASHAHTNKRRGRHAQEPKPNLSLEGRIEHLERQNKILQAALFATLDIGVKQDFSSLLGTSASPVTPSLTGTSFSSDAPGFDGSSMGQEHGSHGSKGPYRPESWNASPGSLGRGSYDSDTSAEDKELEQMVDEFDLDWLSDRSSLMG